MAAQQSIIGRAISQLIAWLAVPRPITFLGLLLVCAGLSQIAWILLENHKEILAWASGIITPLCMVCAAAVWAMRDKMDDQLNTEDMGARAYASFIELSNQQRSRSIKAAAFVAVFAVASSGPAVSFQLAGTIWHMTVIVCGMSVAIAINAYILVNYWDMQIRAYRSQQRLDSKKKQEKKELMAEIRGNAQPTNVGSGWIEGPELKIHPTSRQ